jgi:hypothetical protein
MAFFIVTAFKTSNPTYLEALFRKLAGLQHFVVNVSLLISGKARGKETTRKTKT